MTTYRTHHKSRATAPPPAPVSELLAEYGRATRSVVEHYLPPNPARPYLDELVADYPRRGGKMLRSSICIAHARIHGASIEASVATAAAIELMHNAALIQDDIQDGSLERRGEPTLHVLHGIPLALNAGVSLMLTSLRPLLDNVPTLGADLSLELLREADHMARQTSEGQALELGWRDGNRLDVMESDYLDMVLKKTAWLATIFPARAGAMIGLGTGLDPAAYVAFGFFLGVAFQIQDDLLNLEVNPFYGKEQNGDLFEGKRTLMLIHARKNCDVGERERLDRILASPREQRSVEQVTWMFDLLVRLGSVEYSRAVARGLAGAAACEFERAYGELPDTRDKRFVGGLVTWVCERCL